MTSTLDTLLVPCSHDTATGRRPEQATSRSRARQVSRASGGCRNRCTRQQLSDPQRGRSSGRLSCSVCRCSRRWRRCHECSRPKFDCRTTSGECWCGRCIGKPQLSGAQLLTQRHNATAAVAAPATNCCRTLSAPLQARPPCEQATPAPSTPPPSGSGRAPTARRRTASFGS